jgi:release factor glutamine methyltransferase
MDSRTLSVRRIVNEAAVELARVGVPEPKSSAEVLLTELIGVGRGDLAFYDNLLIAEQAATYETWISRRMKREPVQRILGYAYFRNLKLYLNEDTLIPRPDTESVVDAAIEAVDRRGSSCRVLDVGTGSGAIAISIAQERPACEVHATDDSNGVLQVAHRNAAQAGAMVRFYEKDLTFGLDALEGSVEVVVSNPPYVKSADIPKLAPEVRDWDPRAALDGGPDGLDLYRRIFAEVIPLLVNGADIILEVGDGQAEAVLELGRYAGFKPSGARPDLAGTLRAVLLRWGLG